MAYEAYKRSLAYSIMATIHKEVVENKGTLRLQHSRELILLALIFIVFKTALLCFTISSGFITAFKLLYKESAITVDRS